MGAAALGVLRGRDGGMDKTRNRVDGFFCNRLEMEDTWDWGLELRRCAMSSCAVRYRLMLVGYAMLCHATPEQQPRRPSRSPPRLQISALPHWCDVCSQS